MDARICDGSCPMSQVFGVGTANPYRLRPYLGARVPVNSSFAPLINMHNPHSTKLQVSTLKLDFFFSVFSFFQYLHVGDCANWCIDRMLEMMSNAPTIAGKHITSHLACSSMFRYIDKSPALSCLLRHSPSVDGTFWWVYERLAGFM